MNAGDRPGRSPRVFFADPAANPDRFDHVRAGESRRRPLAGLGGPPGRRRPGLQRHGVDHPRDPHGTLIADARRGPVEGSEPLEVFQGVRPLRAPPGIGREPPYPAFRSAGRGAPDGRPITNRWSPLAEGPPIPDIRDTGPAPSSVRFRSQHRSSRPGVAGRGSDAGWGLAG